MTATTMADPDRKAGFWIRFAAYFIDSVIVGAVSYLPLILFNNYTLTVILGLILGIAYFIYFWSGAGGGQTLGMRILGLRVVKTDGQELSIGAAALRYVGFILASLPFLLGLIWAAFDRNKQGWHDKMANTFVIRTR